MTRLATVATLAGLLAATTLVPAGPASAAGISGACTDPDGVTVVVDFQQLGGPTLVRCAAGPQPTGLAALKNAGFAVTGTIRWGEAFICRIEGRPGPDTERCVDTPPASAYWSYWHAPNGGSWTYSQQGVTGRAPVPGGFEGWSFSLDRSRTAAPPPRLDPHRPPPADPPSEPGAGQPTRPDTGGAGDDPGSRPGGGGPADQPPARQPPVGGGTAGAPEQTGGPGPAESPRPGTAGTTTPDRPPGATAPTVPTTVADETVPDAAARRTTGPAFPVGTMIGLGLLLALVVAAAVTVRRRAAGHGGPDG